MHNTRSYSLVRLATVMAMGIVAICHPANALSLTKPTRDIGFNAPATPGWVIHLPPRPPGPRPQCLPGGGGGECSSFELGEYDILECPASGTVYLCECVYDWDTGPEWECLAVVEPPLA